MIWKTYQNFLITFGVKTNWRNKRQQQNSKIEKDSRYSFNGSVGMLFFFLANILQNIPILKVIEIKQIGVAENNVSISILYP